MGKDDTKYWKECLAKVIMEDLFYPGKFDKAESPDLQGDGVGIEVTQAYPAMYQWLDGEYEKYAVALGNGDVDKAEYHRRKSVFCNHLNDVSSCEECIRKYPGVVHQACGRFMSVCGIGGEVFTVRIVHLSAVSDLPRMVCTVCDVFRRKLEKLNAGHYAWFDTMGLFIETSFFTNVEAYVDELFCRMRRIGSEYARQYDVVFLYGRTVARLCRMDFMNGTLLYYDIDGFKYDRLADLSFSGVDSCV